MRIALGLMVVTLSACTGDDGPGSGGSAGSAASTNGQGMAGTPGSAPGAAGSAGSANPANHAQLVLPQVYPPVRAATPSALIADPAYASLLTRPAEAASKGFGTARQALSDAVNLASTVQDRFYSSGPTDLLRIVKALDDRVAGLDVNAPGHPCLDATPTTVQYALPGGQSFRVELQCLQQFGMPGAGGSGWLAFGFAPALPGEPGSGHLGPPPTELDAGARDAGPDGGENADAGPTDIAPRAALDAGAAEPVDGNDFYLIEGQPGGNGGAYRIRPNGDVEGWLAVAERNIPANSQVLLHLRTHEASGTLELALAGAGVGFCAAHLKTNPDFLFVSGKTNAPPPPGTMQQVGTQYCDAPRSGCFQATALATDLGASSPSCSGIAANTFDIGVELDASSDPGANVVTGNIYTYFSQMPSGVPAF